MKLYFPIESEKLFTSFRLYEPLVGLTSVLDNFDFTDIDLRALKTTLESEEFQQNIVGLILNSYPEKRRLIHIHIPKCAGTHLRARLELKYPTVRKGLGSRNLDPEAVAV
jgi:hypothetical protein